MSLAAVAAAATTTTTKYPSFLEDYCVSSSRTCWFSLRCSDGRRRTVGTIDRRADDHRKRIRCERTNSYHQQTTNYTPVTISIRY